MMSQAKRYLGFYRKAFLLLSLTALSACGRDDENGSTLANADADAGATTKPLSLTGTWIGDCVTTEEAYMDQGYRKVTFAFEGTAYMLEIQIYSDALCTHALSKQNQSGTYTVDTAFLANSFTLQLDDWQVTPLSNEQAADYNEQKLCGYDDWSNGLNISILGRRCKGSQYPQKGTKNQTVYKRQANVMIVGNDVFQKQ